MTADEIELERWLPVKGYEGSYEVSDLGRVRSIDRIVLASDGRKIPMFGTLLSPSVDPRKGYFKVNLYRGNKQETIPICRLVVAAFHGLPEGHEADHKDGNRKNDRYDNLRAATESQNMWNTALSKRNKSGVKGVWFYAKKNKWLVNISAHGHQYNLGRYDSFEEAVRIRREAEAKLHGEFARTV